MITEKKLYSELEDYKKRTVQLFEAGKMNECLEAMGLACVLARQYYLIWDIPEFEEILSKASADISGKERRQVVRYIKKRIVFYDTHATDNYVLTQQYLAAVLAWDVEVLFLTTKEMDHPERSNIKKMLVDNPNARIQEIPEKMGVMETAKFIKDATEAFEPDICLIHTQSFDLSGIIAYGAIDGATTYYIETSDHIFWLGTRAFDYYIVFRSLGYNTCIQHRGIPHEKILLQPYYPVMYSKRLQPFPIIKDGSVKILSGARLEKVYGAGDKYFELIEEILKRNQNVEFYYVGAGVYGKLAQTSYLEKQIKKRNYGERFHVLGFRNDITELMKRMDIYMGTYPIGGGLMTQIAASQELPIVQFVSEGLSSSVGEFVDCEKKDQHFVFSDTEKFLDEVSKLVNDFDYRKKIARELKASILKEEEFNEQLKVMLQTGKYTYKPEIYDTDCLANRNNQISIENNCSHDHSRIIIKSGYVRKKQPIKYAVNMIDFLLHVDKKWLLKNVTGK